MNNGNQHVPQLAKKPGAESKQDVSAKYSTQISSQIRLFTLVVLTVFFGEALVMFILNFLPPFPAFWLAFLDATLLIILTSPVLYFGLFRSLVGQLNERKKIQLELEQHRHHLEEMIRDRTQALTEANKKLVREMKERSLAKNELQESEERFRSVVETAVEGIVVVDGEGFIQSWNNGAQKMFGYSAAEINGRSIDLIIPQRFLKAHRCAMKKVVATGKARLSGKTLNMTGVRKDGTEFPLELTLAIWKSHETINITAVIRDVTEKKSTEKKLSQLNFELEDRVKQRTAELRKEIAERKAVEEKISQSKSMLQAVFDGISDPLILVDKAMNIRMMNEGARTYYGIHDIGAALGKPCEECVGQSERCAECEIPTMVLKGRQTTFERRSLIKADRLEQISIYPTKGHTGVGGDAIIRITDITDAKKFERRLIQSEKMASLGVLVSSIAHEINNPNNFVSFNIPILREYIESVIPILDDYHQGEDNLELCNMPYPDFRKDLFKLLDNIENGSRRISSFVSNLRDYSQGSPNKAFSWLDLALLVDKVLSIIQPKINSSVKSFTKKISTDMPEIYSDRNAIEQVLINLLVNAAHAVDGADSRVELTVMPDDEAPGGVVIEVSDNGCGMDAMTRRKIFDPFFTTKSPADGTGLGLYVCHNLIQGLGGRIDVESEPGQGSKFKIILPGRNAPGGLKPQTLQ